MTDLDMTKLCAEAEGRNWADEEARRTRLDGAWRTLQETEYDPLHNDAQAMALVKKFKLDIEPCFDEGGEEWFVSTWREDQAGRENRVSAADLNRAIVECVAKMQVDRTAQETVAMGKAE